MGKVNLSGKLINVPEYYLKSFFQVQVFLKCHTYSEWNSGLYNIKPLIPKSD